ncbi:hypothetical protein CBR_g50643, partial [Chara braunii]
GAKGTRPDNICSGDILKNLNSIVDEGEGAVSAVISPKELACKVLNRLRPDESPISADRRVMWHKPVEPFLPSINTSINTSCYSALRDVVFASNSTKFYFVLDEYCVGGQPRSINVRRLSIRKADLLEQANQGSKSLAENEVNQVITYWWPSAESAGAAAASPFVLDISTDQTNPMAISWGMDLTASGAHLIVGTSPTGTGGGKPAIAAISTTNGSHVSVTAPADVLSGLSFNPNRTHLFIADIVHPIKILSTAVGESGLPINSSKEWRTISELSGRGDLNVSDVSFRRQTFVADGRCMYFLDRINSRVWGVDPLLSSSFSSSSPSAATLIAEYGQGGGDAEGYDGHGSSFKWSGDVVATPDGCNIFATDGKLGLLRWLKLDSPCSTARSVVTLAAMPDDRFHGLALHEYGGELFLFVGDSYGNLFEFKIDSSKLHPCAASAPLPPSIPAESSPPTSGSLPPLSVAPNTPSSLSSSPSSGTETFSSIPPVSLSNPEASTSVSPASSSFPDNLSPGVVSKTHSHNLWLIIGVPILSLAMVSTIASVAFFACESRRQGRVAKLEICSVNTRETSSLETGLWKPSMSRQFICKFMAEIAGDPVKVACPQQAPSGSGDVEHGGRGEESQPVHMAGTRMLRTTSCAPPPGPGGVHQHGGEEPQALDTAQKRMLPTTSCAPSGSGRAEQHGGEESPPVHTAGFTRMLPTSSCAPPGSEGVQQHGGEETQPVSTSGKRIRLITSWGPTTSRHFEHLGKNRQPVGTAGKRMLMRTSRTPSGSGVAVRGWSRRMLTRTRRAPSGSGVVVRGWSRRTGMCCGGVGDGGEEPHPFEVKRFRFAELSQCTDDFSSSSRVGERGAFGEVYRGRIGEQQVAIKLMSGELTASRRRMFIAEVNVLSRLHHANLIRLVGYCGEGSRAALVYPYFPGGSLYDRLHRREESIAREPLVPPPLTLVERMCIAMQIAKGLAYLHDGADPPIIHRDVKSSNVLLGDGSGVALPVVVADFGLATTGGRGGGVVTEREAVVKTLHGWGTVGYMAPEYWSSGVLSQMIDVYSFGVILLELLTGRKPVWAAPSGVGLLTLVESVDWAKPLLESGHRVEAGGMLSEMVDPCLRDEAVGLPSGLVVMERMLCLARKCLARQERLTLHVAALRRLLAILSDPNRTLPIIPVRLGTSTRVYSALWDSGSQGGFIHPRVVKEVRLPMRGSPTPISVILGDDKTQRFFDQTVTDLPFFLTLEPTDRSPASRRHRFSAHFGVMETGYDFILGTPWSRRFRSTEADWATNTLVLKTKCGQTYRVPFIGTTTIPRPDPPPPEPSVPTPSPSITVTSPRQFAHFIRQDDVTFFMVDVTDLLHYDPPCPDAELIPLEPDPPSISMAPISTSVPLPSVKSTPPSGTDVDAKELARYTADLEPTIRDLIREYHDVFPSSFSYAGIPPMRDVEHSIQLVPDYRRLRVGERALEADGPVGGGDEYDNGDEGECEAQNYDRSDAFPLRTASMGGRGSKSRAFASTGRWGKKAVAGGGEAEVDGEAEGGRNFWSVEHMVALIRAKRDQDVQL